jgi:hypothetical protein
MRPHGSPEQLERLLLMVAKACGLPTDLWTCPRVAHLIERHFGVRYHVDHIGRSTGNRSGRSGRKMSGPSRPSSFPVS